MLKPAFVLPSPSAAGVRDSSEEIPGQICSQLEGNNKPGGTMSSRTGIESEYITFRLPEGGQLSSVYPTPMSSGGEADAFDLGGEVDVRGCIVLEEGSMLPCIAQVVTGLGEGVGMRRLLDIVWPMGCAETRTDIWLLRGSTSMRVSSTGSGVCVDEEGRYGLARERAKAMLL
jgi:hypothetical protein